MPESASSQSLVLYSVEDNVATITLNRPEKLNALSAQLMADIPNALGEAERDEDVRCVLITGAGRYFCSGADLTEEGEHPYFATNEGPMAGFGRLVVTVRHMKKPSVAAINGGAAGGGLGLALACDFRICADNARLTTVFMRRSIQPDPGVTYLLPRLVRLDKALELLFFADNVQGQEAEDIGLVTHIVPADELMVRAFAYARRIAKGPVAITTARKAVYQNLSHELATATDVEEYYARLVGNSQDAKEGMASFIEKREPNYVGR